ncbi:MAG: hypothetical protein CFE21_11170 [Bacteroidetes bacterium B1(2017)]|nr:MAG: hypothetical protein CFE21_11170 [Bacteroidetes bacterium B1(2017)]
MLGSLLSNRIYIGMKINLNKLISILLPITFCIFSCKDRCRDKDISPEIKTYLIEEDYKVKFPFKDKDTQIYISNLGDTAILFGNLDSSFVENVSTNHEECTKSITQKSERLTYLANGFNPELFSIKFDLNANWNWGSRSVIECQINEKINRNCFPEPLLNMNNYTDSVLINGIAYFGVPVIEKDVIYLLYNYNYGFLKIDINGGKTWIKQITH